VKASGWSQSAITTTHVLSTRHAHVAHFICVALFCYIFIVECSIGRFLCTMHVFDVRASSSPIGYHGVKFRFGRTPIAELACGKNCILNHPITHSVIQSVTHSLTHSPSLFDALGTEACTLEY